MMLSMIILINVNDYDVDYDFHVADIEDNYDFDDNYK